MRSNRANDGRAFQALLEKIFFQYQTEGWMRIKKVDPPTRIVGGKIMFMANPWLDYCGSWTESGGRMIVIEAKSTKEPRLPIGHGGLTDRQREALRHWRLAGAVACVLWEYAGSVRLFTEEVIDAAAVAGDRSLKFDCEGAVVVSPGQGWVIYDVRETMQTIWMRQTGAAQPGFDLGRVVVAAAPGLGRDRGVNAPDGR